MSNSRRSGQNESGNVSNHPRSTAPDGAKGSVRRTTPVTFPGQNPPFRASPYVAGLPAHQMYPAQPGIQQVAQFPQVNILPPTGPWGNPLEAGGIRGRAMTSNPSRRFVCEHCSSRFERPVDLETHKRSHTGERPFVCSYPGCGKAFTVKSNMIRHERIHTAESQFIYINDGGAGSSQERQAAPR